MPIGFIDYSSPSPNTGVPGAIAQAYGQYKDDENRRAQLLMQQQHNKALEDHAAAELEMERRNQEEKQRSTRLAAIKEIGSALDAGRPDYAKQVMQEYGIPFQEVVKHQDPRNTLMPPSDEVPQTPEEGPQATPQIAQEAGVFRARQAAGDATEPRPQDAQAQVAAAEQERQRFATAQQPTSYVTQPPMAPKPDKTTYMVAGQPYDPEQRRAAADAIRQRDAEENRAAFEQLGPGLGDFAYSMTMAGNDKSNVAALVRQHMDNQATNQSRLEDKAAQRDFQAEQNRMFRLTLGQRESLADRNGQWGVRKMETLAGPKYETTDINATKALESSLQSQWKGTEMDKLLSATRLMGQASAALNSDDSAHPGAAQVGARTLMERVIRQGIPTAYLDQRERAEVTGITGKIESLVSRLSGEGLGDQEKAAYQQELDTYANRLQGYVQKSVGGMQQRIKSDPSYRNLQGTADQWLRGRLSSYGIDLPGGEHENNLPAMGSRSSALEEGRRGQRNQDMSRSDTFLAGDPGPGGLDQGETGQGFNPPRLTAEERQPASLEELKRLAGGAESFGRPSGAAPRATAAAGVPSQPHEITFTAEAARPLSPAEMDQLKVLDHQTDPREMERLIHELTAKGLIKNAQIQSGEAPPPAGRQRRGQAINDAVRSLDDLAKAHGL